MPNEPDAPPPPGSPLPAEARRRGGMDTLFSAAWFDDEQPETASAAQTVPHARPPAPTKGPPDPMVIAIAALSALGLLGFSCMSVALTGVFAYFSMLPV